MNDYSSCGQPGSHYRPSQLHPEVRGDLPQAGGQIQQFAANLRFWRETSGLLINQAADQLGVGKSTWCQWESGKRVPTVSYVPLLCHIIHISACSLFAASPEECLGCPRRKG